MPAPEEQFRMELFFQFADMLAETLLGYKGPFGCLGEIHLFRRQQKHFLRQFHGTASFFCIILQSPACNNTEIYLFFFV